MTPTKLFIAPIATLILIDGAAGRTEIPSERPVFAATRDTTLQITDAMIDAGRKIYHGSGLCLACHGPKLEGSAVAPNLDDEKWLVADSSYASILKVIQTGVAGTAMQAHPGGIHDEMAGQVAAYVWAVSQGKAKP